MIIEPSSDEMKYTRAAPENFKRRCWGSARSMTGGAGQLIVNMTKTGYYYYFFLYIWIIKTLYRRISNVYEEYGSIFALSLLYDMGACTQYFIFYFSCGKSFILPSFLDVLSVVSCSLHEWSASQQWTSSQTSEIKMQKAWKPIKIKIKNYLIM